VFANALPVDERAQFMETASTLFRQFNEGQRNAVSWPYDYYYYIKINLWQ
jgi:hypothetical protein